METLRLKELVEGSGAGALEVGASAGGRDVFARGRVVRPQQQALSSGYWSHRGLSISYASTLIDFRTQPAMGAHPFGLHSKIFTKAMPISFSRDHL